MAEARERIGQAFRDLSEPEGLATGALGAFLFGGPVGIALGLGQGILARRLRESEAEKAAKEQEMLTGIDELFTRSIDESQGLGSTEIDKAQIQQVAKNYQILRKLTMSPDEDTRQNAIAKLADYGNDIGAWLEDLEGRNETVFDRNVALLDDQASLLAKDYKAGLDRGQDVTRISSEIHQLLSDESFDPNKPINRARLGQLLDQTPRELLADAADMSDALREAGAELPGVIGAVSAWISGKQKAAEFQFSKEDWRKVAYAMTIASKKQSDRMLQDATQRGQFLDETAGKIGHAPALSYLDRILTGTVQEAETVRGERGGYERAPMPTPGEVAPTAAREPAQSLWEKTKKTADEVLENTTRELMEFGREHLGFKDRKKHSKRRPTNGATGEF